MKLIISCDWGTSMLRLRVVDATSIRVLSEVVSNEGIAATFESWRMNDGHDINRLAFYQSVLDSGIKKLEQQMGASLDGLPLVISGMASSGMGMMEVDYKSIPLNLSNPGLMTRKIEATKAFKHEAWIISGIRMVNDVMRGEETQLLGCWDESARGKQVYIFPGTHSKQVVVENGVITDFKTCMTGELFDLLATKSILASSVSAGGNLDDDLNRKSFSEGVRNAGHSNFLHDVFMVRTNRVFDKLTAEQNYYYLSGMVIGTELSSLPPGVPVILVSSGQLKDLYTLALNIKMNKAAAFACKDPALALVKGQIGILGDRVL